MDVTLHSVETAPTITKLRILSRNQQLIRLDFEDGFHPEESAVLLSHLGEGLDSCNVVVLSDYGKGALADCPAFIERTRSAGKRVLVDPKGNDFSRYRRASMITPNLNEFEAVVGICRDADAIGERGENLRRELGLEALLITRSEHGITLIEKNEAPLHLPTEAQEVFDVTGAGDTVIATLAAVLAAGDTYAHAAALANVAAGLVVAKRGTATVTRNELEIAVEARGMSRHGIFTEDELERLVTTARQRGQKVVMTNGCFDILHAGHVAYLKEARALGDRLIVAVNSDDSTRRLKGENRPVNRLADRMTVLAALEAVDWVVPFEEDTPERLICRVLPDVLVKGGDYKSEDVAGSDCVTANGGEVRVLRFHEGRSSSSIIEALEDA